MYRKEEQVSDRGSVTVAIFKTLEDGTELGFTDDPGNSDYQTYLRWLNGEDEAQSL